MDRPIKTIKIGDLDVGREPRIVAVINGSDPAQLISPMLDGQPDILEFRADMVDRDRIGVELTALRKIEPNIPILLTIRHSGRDWGAFRGDETERLSLFRAFIPEVDAVDIEVRADEINTRVIEVAREYHRPVIASYHDFLLTPHLEELREIREKANRLQADILKIEVMARTLEEVTRLQKFTVEPHGILVTTTSAGPLGRVSRTVNHLLGSCLAYGYVGEPTTPSVHVARIRGLFSALGTDRTGLEEARKLTEHVLKNTKSVAALELRGVVGGASSL